MNKSGAICLNNAQNNTARFISRFIKELEPSK